jgi:hypothetical protein
VNVLASSATPPRYKGLVKTGEWSFSSRTSMNTLAVLAAEEKEKIIKNNPKG